MPEKQSDEALLKEARKRFKLAWDAESNQRKRDKKALEWQVGEYQWDAEARQENLARKKKPLLTVPKLRQPLNLIRNQFRAAHFGINIHPKNERSSKKGAEIRQDIIRTIEADSGAEGVLFWAYDRAVQCGLGAVRVRAVYDDANDYEAMDPSDPRLYDQKLVIERIYDQSLVLFDPAAQKADMSDGRFAFQLTWVPVDEFAEQFPNAEHDYTNADTFDEARTQEPNWVRGDGDTRAVLVAEYFCRKVKHRKLVTFKDETRGYEDEAGDREIDPEAPSRPYAENKVYIHKLTALEILETNLWAGTRLIPLAPALGDELQPFDGERRRMGLVEPAMDACQGYNYAVSKATEIVALEPKAPVVGWEGMFEGHEDKWNTVNTHDWAYLEVKTTTLDGNPAPSLPQRMQTDTSKLGMAIQMAQQFDQDIQSSTNVFDAALGRFDSRRQSGKAIDLLQSQSDAGTSGFMHQMQQITYPLLANILLDAMPAVYDRPERVMQVIDAEGRPRPVMLNHPFKIDQNTGMPVPAQEGEEGVEAYDLRGEYGVTVTIGKSYQSRQQQGQEQLGQLIASSPEMMLIFGDIYARFLDVPGAPEIADRMLKLIEQRSPGLTMKQGQQPDAAQLQAQMQAKDAELQKLQQMLAQATQALETEMAKQKATLEKAQMDNAGRAAIASQNNMNKLMVERLESLTQIVLEEMKQREAAKQREHDAGMARASAGMQADENERGRRFQSEEGERARTAESAEGEINREFEASQADLERQAAAEQAERDNQAAMAQPDGGGV